MPETVGYNTGLAYCEVTAYDHEGYGLNTIRTRVKRNDGSWVTNHDAWKSLKADFGDKVAKIKRRNVWKYEEITND